MTISAKKVSISSKLSIVCLLCPPPCGPFSIQESAVGGLSYKVKKISSRKSCCFLFVKYKQSLELSVDINSYSKR